MGKTVAVEQALHLLPARVPVWRAVVGVRPGLPQVRAALCEALGLPSGSLTHRDGPADQALAEPGVLFLDDAQRLSPLVLDYLRQLWGSPGCAAALVLCCAVRGGQRAGAGPGRGDAFPGPDLAPGQPPRHAGRAADAGSVPSGVGGRGSGRPGAGG
ncbi:ATP-binding protein [Streptomyces prunicolor]|uniref:ATP-binding protein n=1 Tax=Streptomyces prunicolor TaxID=67348 RepID=UPI0037D9A4F4